MENKIPIYRQIEQYIMNNIEDGIYAEGMMIPSEEDFCEKFHTSRMTVRKAFDILQTKGILHKKKVKGTFVSTFSIERKTCRPYMAGKKPCRWQAIVHGQIY